MDLFSNDSNSIEKLESDYFVTIINGRFMLPSMEKELRFKEGAQIVIRAKHSDLHTDGERQSGNQPEMLIEEGEILTFKIKSDTFQIKLLSPLFLEKEGTRFSRLSPVHCRVEKRYRNGNEVRDFEPVETDSLNQAYTQASIACFPNQGTHNRNVFDVMRWQGRLLKEYRKF